jgi:hypothetical protein
MLVDDFSARGTAKGVGSELYAENQGDWCGICCQCQRVNANYYVVAFCSLIRIFNLLRSLKLGGASEPLGRWPRQKLPKGKANIQINLTSLNFCLAQLWKSKHFHNIRSLKFDISLSLH